MTDKPVSRKVAIKPATGQRRQVDYSSELNPEQLAVVMHPGGPMLVLAGAGSGKTRTVVYRVARLIEDGVEPSAILLLTFTNRAAREMLARVGQLLGRDSSRTMGGTFHSVGNRLLRRFGERLGYQPHYGILDREDAQDLIGAAATDVVPQTPGRRLPGAALLLELYSFVINTGRSLEEVIAQRYPQFGGDVDIMQAIFRRYLERKHAAQVMDYDDLLLNWLLLLRRENDVRRQLAARFRHVLVDFDSPSAPNSYSFYPAPPCRVADTGGAAGTFGGPTMYTDETRDFPIPESPCPIPATATAYSLNVTVVPGGFLGYLTTWPTGVAQPLVSTLNSWTGKVVANAALVPAANNESISVFVSNPTDVILDINGCFGQPGSPGALLFYPVTPCRVVDTRNPDGPFGGPEMAAEATRSFAIPAGLCSIPSTAAAYSMNVTVVPDGVLYYLTAWPTGVSQPLVSTLNSFDGTVVANAAIVPAGTSGAISLFVTNQTHVILAINGYFAP